MNSYPQPHLADRSIDILLLRQACASVVIWRECSRCIHSKPMLSRSQRLKLPCIIQVSPTDYLTLAFRDSLSGLGQHPEFVRCRARLTKICDQIPEHCRRRCIRRLMLQSKKTHSRTFETFQNRPSQCQQEQCRIRQLTKPQESCPLTFIRALLTRPPPP